MITVVPPSRPAAKHGLARSVLTSGGVTTALLAVLLTGSPARADYPLVSHRYLADPGSLVYNGRIYLYASNDDDNPIDGGYEMHSIVCVSTGDLKNWTDHGVVFQVPEDASWARYSWAPQPIQRNGTVYLYFGNNASGVGVASSTDPTGGFADARGSYLVNSNTPGAAGTNSWLFDPGAFIDDDGTAYLSFGGNGMNNARIIRLGSDLHSVSGSALQVPTTDTSQFFEASFLFKRNGLYYFAYSTNPNTGLRIDYLTSSSPMTGYTYRGVVADQPPSNNNNNHASEFEFNGQWYHAYHNRIVANQSGINPNVRRNLAIEVLNFNADGSIQRVSYTTDGVPQVGHLDPYVRVEAETTNAQRGIETGTSNAGGMAVTDIDDGDWIRLRGLDFGANGATSFRARVASASAGGRIELRLGSDTGTLIGACDVPATGGDQEWVSTTCSVTGAAGIQDLYLKFGGANFNVDYWQFTGDRATGGTGGTGGTGATGGVATGGVGTGGIGGAAGTGAAGTGGIGTGGTVSTGGTFANGGSGGEPPWAGQSGAAGDGTGTGGNASGGNLSGSGGAMLPAASDEDSGCACRTAGATRQGSDPALFGLLGLFMLRRRRSAWRSPPS